MRLKIFITLLLISAAAFAQMPLEFQKAINKSTRTSNGLPGSNYWQNRSEYNIDARFTSGTRTLTGSESIKYYNNSPDTLKYIVVRLYQNWNLPGKARDWDIDTIMFTEGVKIDEVKINNIGLNISDKDKFKTAGTNLILVPESPILPHSSAALDFKWSFAYPPKTNLRCGYYDETSYMVAYWYPQIAVYDDIDGWDVNDYTGSTEFYNDFSDFNVRISTDLDNAIIIATGELQNSRELFSDNFLEKYNAASTSDDMYSLSDPRSMMRAGIFREAGNSRVWNFTAKNVCDFAFAFSDHYIWERSSAPAIDDARTVINVLYKPGEPNFEKVSSITQKLLYYYKDIFPGVAYPYPAISIFDGSYGMEYPMMVNQGAYQKFESTVHVTSHEISHTFFPFYMGTNERKYAWMDEGWAQFIPMDFQSEMGGTNVKDEYSKVFAKGSGTLIDAPLLTLSGNLKYDSYRFNAYTKSWAMYNELKYLLGADKFKQALIEYINRWQGKHPIPIDFMNTFEDVYGSSLSWFWGKWMYDFAYCSPVCTDYKYENGSLILTLKNDGGLPAHLFVKVISPGDEKDFTFSADVWRADAHSAVINIDYPQKPDSVVISGSAFYPVRVK